MLTRANLVEEKVMIKELMKIIVLVAIHVLAFYTLPFGERVKIAILVTTLSTITVGRLTWIMAPEGYRPYLPALLRTCLNVAGGVLGVFGFLGVMFLGSNPATLAILLALVFFSVAEIFRHRTLKLCPTGFVPKQIKEGRRGRVDVADSGRPVGHADIDSGALARPAAHGAQKAMETTLFPCQRLVADLIPADSIFRAGKKSWEPIEDVEPTLKDGCTLDFPTLLKEGDEHITYEVMRSNAKAKDANIGLADVKFILANQHLIPHEMRDKGLLCTGTLLRDFHGGLSIPVLYYGSDGWRLSFHPLSKDGKYNGWPGWSLIGQKKASPSR